MSPLLKDVVEKELCPAVVPTVRSLIIQTPIVGKIFDLVIAARGELTHWCRRITAQNFRDTPGIIEISLEPLKDAGDLHFPFVRQEFIEVFACQPSAIRSVVLFVELIGGVCKPLERRTTARGANQRRVGAIANQGPQRSVLDIV